MVLPDVPGVPLFSLSVARGRYPDLLIRFYQFGVFLNVMRVHSTRSDKPHFPFLFGAKRSLGSLPALQRATPVVQRSRFRLHTSCMHLDVFGWSERTLHLSFHCTLCHQQSTRWGRQLPTFPCLQAPPPPPR